MHVYRVICSDKAIRHAQPFQSAKDAAQFAQWGHVCTNQHTVQASHVSDQKVWTATNIGR